MMPGRFRMLAGADETKRPVWEHHDRYKEYGIVVVEGPGYGWEISIWFWPDGRPDAAVYVGGGSPHPRAAFADVEEVFAFAYGVIDTEIEGVA